MKERFSYTNSIEELNKLDNKLKRLGSKEKDFAVKIKNIINYDDIVLNPLAGTITQGTRSPRPKSRRPRTRRPKTRRPKSRRPRTRRPKKSRRHKTRKHKSRKASLKMPTIKPVKTPKMRNSLFNL
jgi:hypothetical protein